MGDGIVVLMLLEKVFNREWEEKSRRRERNQAR